MPVTGYMYSLHHVGAGVGGCNKGLGRRTAGGVKTGKLLVRQLAELFRQTHTALTPGARMNVPWVHRRMFKHHNQLIPANPCCQGYGIW